MSERSNVLDTLLRLVFYPIADPLRISSLEELALVLEAAIKYDFVLTAIFLRRHLISSPHFFTNISYPRVCVALAPSRYGLDEEMRLGIALRYTLSINMLDTSSLGNWKTQFNYITLIHRLLNFHRQRSKFEATQKSHRLVACNVMDPCIRLMDHRNLKRWLKRSWL